MNYLLLIGIVLTVFAQNGGNSNGGSSSGGNSTTSGNSTCDAFSQICSTTPDNCNPSTYGTTVINSPGDQGGTYSYTDRPINFTWSYTGQYDSAYPKNSVYLYYRQHGATAWTFLTKTGKTNSVNGTISNAVPGQYEVLVMPDNIDTNNLYGVGTVVSCTPDGWPYPQKLQFSLLQSTSYQVYPDKFPPATNSAIIPGMPLLYLMLYMI
ncbi:hypothetical protein HDV01_005225 [Terramyces sp. JEL0728]|nr:hypothetical protein HDV01_005225 [Terramyces sp. JEL0728]